MTMLSAAVVGSTLASSSDAEAGVDCGEGFKQVVVVFSEATGFREFTSCTFNEAPPPPPKVLPAPLEIPELPGELLPEPPPGDPVPFE